MSDNSFDARAQLKVGDREYEIFRLDALQASFDVARLPFSLKVLLENLLRNEDGTTVTPADIEALARLAPQGRAQPTRSPSARRACCCRTSPACRRSSTSPRCATRWASSAATPTRINPLQPAELVIDHSVQVDDFGTTLAFQRNAELEFERNHERYAFLRWGQRGVPQLQGRAARHRHRPPGQPRVPGARGLPRRRRRQRRQAYPDTLVGTDSHTTMINGLGVLGWGVGGIEAEAAMLGQPVSMLIPQVVGFKLSGELPEGATATDLVLTVTEMLRKNGVVGKFVEFYGAGLARAAAGRPRHDRQHGAGVRRHLRDLPDRRRDAALPALHRPLRGARSRWSRPTRASRACSTGPTPGGDLHRHAGARPRRRRAEPRRPAPPAGSRRAADGQGVLRAASCRRCSSRRRGRPSRARRRSRASPARAVTPRSAFRTSVSETAVHVECDRGEFHARPRLGRDRRDHELHQHLEPVGDDRRRPAGQEGGRDGACDSKPWVKTSLAPGLEGRHRLPRQAGLDRFARAARLQPGRLRLHDLHRQLRAAAGRDLGSDRAGRSRRGLGAVGQPQLRGPHPLRGQAQLPGLAAAGGRLRARRPHGRRSPERAARRGLGRRTRSTCATSGRAEREIARRR